MTTSYYTLKEAADRFRISTKTLSAILKQHSCCARVGRKFVISDADLAHLYEVLRSSSNQGTGRSTLIAGMQVAPSEAKLYARLRELTDGAKQKERDRRRLRP